MVTDGGDQTWLQQSGQDAESELGAGVDPGSEFGLGSSSGVVCSDRDANVEQRLFRLERATQRLWDVRERDVAAVAELIARLKKFEAGFESAWSVVSRTEAQLADLVRSVDQQDQQLVDLVVQLRHVAREIGASVEIPDLAVDGKSPEGSAPSTGPRPPVSDRFDDRAQEW